MGLVSNSHLPAPVSQVLKVGSIPGRGCERVEMTTKNLESNLNLLDEQHQGFLH